MLQFYFNDVRYITVIVIGSPYEVVFVLPDGKHVKIDRLEEGETVYTAHKVVKDNNIKPIQAHLL
jgi:hypothetical protein